jgi:hypothetical protein
VNQRTLLNDEKNSNKQLSCINPTILLQISKEEEEECIIII